MTDMTVNSGFLMQSLRDMLYGTPTIVNGSTPSAQGPTPDFQVAGVQASPSLSTGEAESLSKPEGTTDLKETVTHASNLAKEREEKGEAGPTALLSPQTRLPEPRSGQDEKENTDGDAFGSNAAMDEGPEGQTPVVDRGPPSRETELEQSSPALRGTPPAAHRYGWKKKLSYRAREAIGLKPGEQPGADNDPDNVSGPIGEELGRERAETDPNAPPPPRCLIWKVAEGAEGGSRNAKTSPTGEISQPDVGTPLDIKEPSITVFSDLDDKADPDPLVADPSAPHPVEEDDSQRPVEIPTADGLPEKYSRPSPGLMSDARDDELRG